MYFSIFGSCQPLKGVGFFLLKHPFLLFSIFLMKKVLFRNITCFVKIKCFIHFWSSYFYALFAKDLG